MPLIIAFSAAVAVLYVVLSLFQHFTQHPDEPKLISLGYPFISTAFAIFSKGKRLHPLLRDKYKLPIYTLRLPGLRLYIVNSRPLISNVQAQFRKLSFCPLEAHFLKNIIGVNNATNSVIRANINDDSGYFMQFPKYIHNAVFPGPGLDALNKRAIQVISESFDKWTTTTSMEPQTFQLFEWVRHEILIATTESVYGPNNPFRDPSMEKAWYEFEPKMAIFALNLWPKLFANKAYRAREYMASVWENYFEKGWHNQSAEITKARVKLHTDFHISSKENARIEIGGTQTVLSNSIPGALWMVNHVFADQSTLSDIRTELLKGAKKDTDGTWTIDSDFVTGSCPILLSTFKEMLRCYANNTSTRLVMEDYMLDGSILLKRGSILMVPSRVQHTDREVWGASVDAFDHRRFLPVAENKKDGGGGGKRGVYNRGFGGGKTLCPGRQFATVEIIMFAALLALKFDIRPTNGPWVTPTADKTPGHNAMKVPDWDFEVMLSPRETEKKWKVLYSGQGLMELSVEDMDGTAVDRNM